jgi:hypothetical protein
MDSMPVVLRYVLKRIVILAAAAVAILSLYSAVFISGALAQEIKQQIAGVPGEDLPLRLELPAQPDTQGASSSGFIRILGLPPSFSLNRGFAAVGTWAVSLGDAGGLTLATPKDFQGNLLLTIELVRDQSTEPERWRVLVTLGQKQDGATPPPPMLATMTPASPGDSQPQPADSIGSMKAAQPLRAASRAQMNRAQDLLKLNDVAAARLIFKRLAETGIAEAAFGLAQTYDPDFLKTIPTAGLQPDMATARHWYEWASALGSAPAGSRLSEIKGR